MGLSLDICLGNYSTAFIPFSVNSTFIPALIIGHRFEVLHALSLHL
jgi:hypothetical protein